MHEIYIIFQFNLHRYAIVTVLFLCYDLGIMIDDYSEARIDRRYSRDDAKDHMMNKLGAMMEDADPNEREILKKCMRELERA